MTERLPEIRNFHQLDEDSRSRGWSPVYIYCLQDPDTLEIRYIGKTVNPKQRYSAHLRDDSQCHRANWIKNLRQQNKMPLMAIIEEAVGEYDWQAAEAYWIAWARAHGLNLTNSTDGGDGVVNLCPEAKARMSTAWIGRKHKPETIEKLRAISANRRHSSETRHKMGMAHKGRQILWTDKIAEANRKIGKEQAEEICARLANGERVKDIAKELGVHRTTVSKLKMGKYFLPGKSPGGTWGRH